MMSWWTSAGPAIGSAFLASLVEVVEAFTIVLAVATVRGWRPALLGTVAGLAALTIIVIGLGPLLDRVPLAALQLVIGVLLLLFGMRWLSKAILRGAGIIALHDEDAAFAKETAALGREEGDGSHRDWIAGIAAFKAVLLEGIEVVFIVIAVGAGRSLLVPAGLGALIACAVVLMAGILIHRPLARVPENALKLVVGVMLSSFGLFWTGEGLGIDWPARDAAIVVFAAALLVLALGMSRLLAWPTAEATR